MAEEIELHDMKRSAKEKKAREREMAPSSSSDDDYHYGLRIHMDHDSLEKAGLKDSPKPGDMYRVHGVAKVVRSDESADENGQRRNAEFHFHQIGFAPHGDGEVEGEETGGAKGKSLRDQLSENAKESERKTAEKSEKRAAAKTSTATARNEAHGEDL